MTYVHMFFADITCPRPPGAKAGTEREVGRGDAVCALVRDPDMLLIFGAGEW